ncbi:MAG: hypothetical protein IH948_02740, partial [Bacteroidetes bacterium]|nr:hypothetical protein [Bacteroidota bacterium]
TPFPEDPIGIRALNKVTKGNAIAANINANVQIGNLSIGGNFTKGNDKLIAGFMDMNGDRYPDVVTDEKIQFSGPQGDISDQIINHTFDENHKTKQVAWGLSLGGSFATSSKDPAPDPKNASSSSGNFGLGGGQGFDKAEVTWMDINGDGLPDRIDTDAGTVQMNYGYKFGLPETWGHATIREGDSQNFTVSAGFGINKNNGSFVGGISLGRSENVFQNGLQDLNGDGLMDEIISIKPLVIRLNTGNGFSDELTWGGDDLLLEKTSTITEGANIAFTFGFTIGTFKIVFTPQINASQSFSDDHVSIVDADGDGFPDYLLSDEEDELSVAPSTIRRTNLLKSVDRPLGATFTLNYELEGNTFEMQQSLWALTEVRMFDGHVGDGVDNFYTSFEYANGFHDRRERAFYGFDNVIIRQHNTANSDVVYRKKIQKFDNTNFYSKGILLSEALVDANDKKFSEKIYTYVLKDHNTLANDLLVDLLVDFELNGIDIAFPAKISELRNYHEGETSVQKIMLKTYEYGKYGNVAEYTNFGDPSTTDDDFFADINYHEILNNYVVGAPEEIIVTNDGGDELRKRTTLLDQNTGLVKTLKEFLDQGVSATYDMDYDAFGNIDIMTYPKNHKAKRMFYNYDYDDEVNTYPVSVSDAYGYTSASTYDFRYGVPLTTTSMNNQVITYVLDDAGRV